MFNKMVIVVFSQCETIINFPQVGFRQRIIAIISGVIMKSFLFLILSFLAFSSYGQQKYVCKSGNTQRIVEVVYMHPDSKVPCEVKYNKPNSHKVLWNAQNKVGYCESKAKAFVKKLNGLGFTCSSVINNKAVKAHKSIAKDPQPLTPLNQPLTP